MTVAAFESMAADYRTNASAAEGQVHLYRQDTPTRGRIPIIWCHGFQLVADQRQQLTRPYRRFFREVVGRARLPMVAADLGGPSTWANPTSIARIDTLVTWMGANLFTRTDRVVIAGESMGSALALNWAWRNPAKVAALWVRAPITALDAFHDRNAVFTALMDTAYGGLAGFNAALAAHDPAQNRPNLVGLAPVTRLDYTLSDEFIPATEVLAHAAATGVTEVHAHYGDHAGNISFDPAPVADWLADTLR